MVLRVLSQVPWAPQVLQARQALTAAQVPQVHKALQVLMAEVSLT